TSAKNCFDAGVALESLDSGLRSNDHAARLVAEMSAHRHVQGARKTGRSVRLTDTDDLPPISRPSPSMTFNGLSAVRAVKHTARRTAFSIHAVRLVALSFVATGLGACGSDDPAGPRVVSVRATPPLEAKSAQGPTVASANPSYGDQGT